MNDIISLISVFTQLMTDVIVLSFYYLLCQGVDLVKLNLYVKVIIIALENETFAKYNCLMNWFRYQNPSVSNKFYVTISLTINII